MNRYKVLFHYFDYSSGIAILNLIFPFSDSAVIVPSIMLAEFTALSASSLEVTLSTAKSEAVSELSTTASAHTLLAAKSSAKIVPSSISAVLTAPVLISG